MPPKNPAFLKLQLLSLWEVLNWVAFDNFDGLATPKSEGEWLEFMPVEDQRISKLRSAALRELIEALAGGDIEASGYLSIEPLDGRSPIAGFYDWRNRNYMNHSAERSAIPPTIWKGGSVDWPQGLVRGFDREYAGIRLDREKVLALWPQRSGAPHGRSSKSSNVGRPQQYDEAEFLRLCVLEVGQNGLPESPAELVKKMDELISSIWGEGRTPGVTWMKERVRAIYDLQKKYEQ